MVARILVVLVVSTMLVSAVPGLVLSHPPPPPPNGQPKEGCTPGYWKQEHHFDSWTAPYDPTDSLSSAGFSYAGFGSITLLQALQGGGGPGVAGAVQILMRAAVAALLNAASSIDFGFDPAHVVADTNTALASNNRTTILNQAAEWDKFNNLGCPLN